MNESYRTRIAMLSDANNPHTIRWVRALAERGHELLVYSLSDLRESRAFEGLPNVRIESAAIPSEVIANGQGGIGKLRYLRAVPALRRAILAFRPNVVHAHYATSYGLLGLACGARPLVVSVWGMDVYNAPSESLLLRQVVRTVLTRADAVLSTSHVMKARTAELVRRHIHVTPFGVDIRRFAPRAAAGGGSDSKPVVVGTVKTLEPKYGIEYLIRAFARLEHHGIRSDAVRLLIVGSGWLSSDLERLARELGIVDRTEFAGRVSYDSVHLYHQRMDVSVFPSIEDSESFGVAAVEAQACGVPVVVSDVGGLPEVVLRETTGFVVPPRDVDSLASAIARLVVDHDLRRRFGEAARAHVVERFSLEACVRQLEQIYRDLLGRESCRRANA